MLDNYFFEEVKTYIFNLYKNELPSQAVYHNFDHTLQVVETANEIAIAEHISESDLEIVLLASWFHDSGFTIDYKNHEDKSKEIAQNYLTEKGYDKEKTDKVCSAIESTKLTVEPKNKIEEILCDADLHHVGLESFNKKSGLLRSEWESLSGKMFSNIEWYKKNEEFLTKHKFYTQYAFDKLNEQKNLNLLKVKKDLRKAIAKNEEEEFKRSLKKDDLKRKKDKDNIPERGIETMYRVTLKNHLKLSDIADTKANILLSVSAIILSIALSSLFPKLDKPDNYYLIYPTMIFLFITVVTMIFSILSTRPKVTSGNFTKEDIKNRKVNLLFFGNFNKMPLEDFQEGMMDVMSDKDYLYKSLMKDLYFLGLVLEKKYKLLRIAYTIFMFGVVISVIVYVISFVIMKNNSELIASIL
ncbi:Pycsar system effector family protein [Lutibacter sp. B1]|uniref:Pycsar system effector family protein n=1 Tax=Lutibacter sp. B1 TaxID=2725996 RepID=UPI00145689DA|nr:Pycsar system effector family protein [Lutibacter sp. B1]NLP56574.1 HD domain-containing protein [Lutibacter sp. B1]